MISTKEGFIFKEGAKFLTWKKRFLSIETNKISYYTNDNKKNKKGEILIKAIKEVKPIKEFYKQRKYCFAVCTTNRTYYIQASDDENAQSWITAIRSVLGNKSDSSSESSKLESSTTSSRVKEPEKSEKEKKVGLNDFQQLKVIGRGGFGRVLLVKKRETNKVYAMKELKKKVIAARGEIEHTRTEKSVLSKLDHPFLAKLHWSFQTEEKLYFIMDFINGGELFHHLSKEKRFPEDRAKFYAAEIVSGIEYLHKSGVIYRDLKPENLLLNHKGHIVMTDFGLSKEGLREGDTTATFCGTPEYLAPEIIKGEDYTKAIDWWSVGTLVFEMLTGLPPFYTEDEENMYHKIMTAELVIPSFFSAEVGDFITQLLNRDPNQRLQDPDKIKGHPWFSDINWDLLEKMEIDAPFIPQVKSADDVTHIDDEFLDENVDVDEEEDEEARGTRVKPDAFGGFTFKADDAGEGDQNLS